ncbi:MAG TPA: hypothetical protein VGR96_14845 [Acidobacteriaceae bacterium]|nr:hypothetical protein [Acidobacteriaceae bacterium]
MDTNAIVLAIEDEIARLQRARVLLMEKPAAKVQRSRTKVAGGAGEATSFRPADFDVRAGKRRVLSAAGRARIAAAQRARWAREKGTAAAKKAVR